jgi:uncharacterized membrane protein
VNGVNAANKECCPKKVVATLFVQGLTSDKNGYKIRHIFTSMIQREMEKRIFIVEISILNMAICLLVLVSYSDAKFADEMRKSIKQTMLVQTWFSKNCKPSSI